MFTVKGGDNPGKNSFEKESTIGLLERQIVIVLNAIGHERNCEEVLFVFIL